MRLNFHTIDLSVGTWCTLSSLCTCFSHLSAPLKFDPLSEYIISGLPLLAMKRLRLWMNSCVSSDLWRSRYTALVRLQAYRANYALLSASCFFGLGLSVVGFLGFDWYLMAPVKSMQATWKGTVPLVRLSGKCLGGGACHDLSLNRLQPQQLFLTFFTRLRSRGTQYLSLTLAMVKPFPPCLVTRYASSTILAVKGCVSGRYMGYSPIIRPLHSNRPSLFGCKLQLNLVCLEVGPRALGHYCFNLFCQDRDNAHLYPTLLFFLLRLKFDNDVMIKLGRAARLWHGPSLRGHK